MVGFLGFSSASAAACTLLAPEWLTTGWGRAGMVSGCEWTEEAVEAEADGEAADLTAVLGGWFVVGAAMFPGFGLLFWPARLGCCVGRFYGVPCVGFLETQVSRGQGAQGVLLYGGQNGVSASSAGGGDEVRKARVVGFMLQEHGDCLSRQESPARTKSVNGQFWAGACNVKGREAYSALTNAVATRGPAPSSNCFPPRDPRATVEWLCTSAEQFADRRQMMSLAWARAAWPVSANLQRNSELGRLGDYDAQPSHNEARRV
jgi:hypothetical protein